MSDPTYPVDIIKGAWRKIATGVISGTVHRKKTGMLYLQTFRDTTGTPPTSKDEGVLMFQDHPLQEKITYPSAIDVYVWCDEADGVLRVDL